MNFFFKTFSNFIDNKKPAKETETIELAVAILFAEIIRVDNRIEKTDIETAIFAIKNLFNFTDDESEKILKKASKLEFRPTSYRPTTEIIKKHFSHEERIELIEWMWAIAHADDEIDKYEDHIVRKISDLLYVSHKHFILAKKNAKQKLGR